MTHEPYAFSSGLFRALRTMVLLAKLAEDFFILFSALRTMMSCQSSPPPHHRPWHGSPADVRIAQTHPVPPVAVTATTGCVEESSAKGGCGGRHQQQWLATAAAAGSGGSGKQRGSRTAAVVVASSGGAAYREGGARSGGGGRRRQRQPATGLARGSRGGR